MINPTKRYTLTETAELLNISYRTIQRYIADGRIRIEYLTINKRPRIKGTEILKAQNKTL